jgi:hypothetical protein
MLFNQNDKIQIHHLMILIQLFFLIFGFYLLINVRILLFLIINFDVYLIIRLYFNHLLLSIILNYLL